MESRPQRQPSLSAAGNGARPWLYLLFVVLGNAWIVREAFTTPSTGHWNSMHGVWMAMARVTGLNWVPPQWWPWWGGGAPLEYTYAPLIPALTAVISHVFHISLAMAFHLLSGLVYCLGPAVIYMVSWRWFRAPGYSFAVALAYSLFSPCQLIVPDPGAHAASAWGARRMDLIFDWDDLPHLTSLMLMPIAVMLLARALQRRRQPGSLLSRAMDMWLAALPLALMMLSNMFGFVLTAIAVITVPLALGKTLRLAPFLHATAIAATAWVAVCPWFPPSLLLSVRHTATLDGEADTTAHTLLALAVTATAVVAVWRFASRVAEWPLRWLLLFACPALLIPALAQYAGWHFVPQPVRYKLELELVLPWLAVFAARPLFQRIPPKGRMVLVLPLVALGIGQGKLYRHTAKAMLRAVDVASSIEYRSAQWVHRHLLGQRVMMAGSMAAWLNTFVDQPQLGGQSYSTALNYTEDVALYAFYSGQNAGARDAEHSILWMQALGVGAVAVSGPASPEWWKPFAHPRKFDGVLPVLWREDDTTIYRIPQRTASLAHLMAGSRVTALPPPTGADLDKVRPYVAALEDPAAPPADLSWVSANHAVVRAPQANASQVIATQINYHPGWHASAAGKPVRVYEDGLGFLVIDPHCAGDCEVRLDFDGGTETKVCLAASGFLLALVAGTLAAASAGRFTLRPAVAPRSRPDPQA